MKVTREELIKLASISYIGLPEDEIPSILDKVTGVLNYAEQVKELAQTAGEERAADKNKNVFRDDYTGVCEPEEVMALAPHVEGHYFVVPKIIKQ